MEKRQHHSTLVEIMVSRIDTVSFRGIDTIKVSVEVQAVLPYQMARLRNGESSSVVSNRVLKAVEIQRNRYSGLPFARNAEIDGTLLEKIAVLEKKAQDCLIQASKKMNLSARGYHRILRVARTIADLSSQENISIYDIQEALSLRRALHQGG